MVSHKCLLREMYFLLRFFNSNKKHRKKSYENGQCFKVFIDFGMDENRYRRDEMKTCMLNFLGLC
jgi:hypothetical protein